MKTYDFVILDSPPVLRVADPILMASACQFIIFVVEAGRVAAGLVNEATQRFSATDRARRQAELGQNHGNRAQV